MSGKFRLLEVRIKSARLKTMSNVKTYANAYIRPETKLQTKVNSTGGSTPVWDDKFVFSISDNSCVCRFEVFRARRLLRDSLIGTAECDLTSLFKRAEIEGKRDEEACKYDTDHNSSSDDDEDPRYDNMYDTNKDTTTDDDDDDDDDDDGASTWVNVYKGSKIKGMLEVELGVKEYISCVGDSTSPNMAMEYDEFMGYQSKSRSANKRKKHLYSFLCLSACDSSP